MFDFDNLYDSAKTIARHVYFNYNTNSTIMIQMIDA
jgi:hypothetical protein